MNNLILPPQYEPAQIDRELDAMAVERALWIAQWSAERAGFGDLAAEIFGVLAKAAELRHQIEGA